MVLKFEFCEEIQWRMSTGGLQVVLNIFFFNFQEKKMLAIMARSIIQYQEDTLWFHLLWTTNFQCRNSREGYSFCLLRPSQFSYNSIRPILLITRRSVSIALRITPYKMTMTMYLDKFSRKTFLFVSLASRNSINYTNINFTMLNELCGDFKYLLPFAAGKPFPCNKNEHLF